MILSSKTGDDSFNVMSTLALVVSFLCALPRVFRSTYNAGAQGVRHPLSALLLPGQDLPLGPAAPSIEKCASSGTHTNTNATFQPSLLIKQSPVHPVSVSSRCLHFFLFFFFTLRTAAWPDYDLLALLAALVCKLQLPPADLQTPCGCTRCTRRCAASSLSHTAIAR